MAFGLLLPFASLQGAVVYSQDFDGASLSDTLDEESGSGVDEINGGYWNTLAGSGLDLSNGDKDDFPGNTRDDQYAKEWRGFNVASVSFWESTDGNQGRPGVFNNDTGNNIVAVADSDEFADSENEFPESGDGAQEQEDEFNVFLQTGSIDLAGYDPSTLSLSFLSSFRPEEDETSTVHVYVDGNSTAATSLTVSEASTEPFTAVEETFDAGQLGASGNETSVLLEFAHENADNNWWWAIDEIQVEATAVPEPAFTSFFTALCLVFLLGAHRLRNRKV